MKRARPAGEKAVRTDGATAQEQLLDAAQDLFYREGIRAIGVDAVVERAGVNKMSLYRQFSSKEELVVAYLNRMDEAIPATRRGELRDSIPTIAGEAARAEPSTIWSGARRRRIIAAVRS